MLIDRDTAQQVVDDTPLSAARLGGRDVLRISGPDRATFLQGLVSNDVEKAAPGHGVYACFLTPQGKFLHEMVIFAGDDTLLLDTEGGERAADLKRRLSMYKLRSDVSVDTPEPEMAVIAVYGKKADEMTVPAAVTQAVTDPRCEYLGMRLLCPADDADDVLAGLEGQGARIADADDYDIYRLRMAIPDGSRDLQVERATLMESGIDDLNGISWDKGCYMGQELTSRMKYRNLGKKRLMLFRLDGAETLESGSAITKDDRKVGELRSSAGGYAFGLVRVQNILNAKQLPEICHIENVELTPVSIATYDTPADK